MSSGAPPTIAEALQRGRNELGGRSGTPNLDLQLLLMKATRQTRAWVLAHPEAELSVGQAEAFAADLERLIAGTALPYILGWWEFYGRRFQLTHDVLIPRPETELLVEHALRWLAVAGERRALDLESGGGPAAVMRALDLGTGSGAVAVTLALEREELRVMATDVEPAALQVARDNAQWYGVGDRVWLVAADLLAPFAGSFDLICANLPYVPREDLLGLAVSQREPRRALDGGPQGTQLIRRALDALPGVLAAGGLALFEIQPGQAAPLAEAADRAVPGAQIEVRHDLAGQERLLAIQRRG